MRKKLFVSMLSVMLIMTMLPGMAFANDVKKMATGSITDFADSVSIDTAVYDGSEQKPAVTIAGLDSNYYTVSYRNNINASASSTVKPTAIITGKNGYTGSIEKEFTILPRDLSDVYIPDIENQVEGGPIYRPVVTVDGRALKEGTDYILWHASGSGNTIRLTIEGINNYTGEATKTYRVGAKLYPGDFTLQKSEYEYTGEGIKVKVSSKLYREGKDYKITDAYWNSDVGSYTTRIIGIGFYAGEIKFDYKIVPKSITGDDTAVTIPESVYFTGKPAEPEVTVKTANRTLEKNKDYTLSYSNNHQIGTASVTITGKGNYTGTQTINFTIKGKNQTITSDESSYIKYLSSKPFPLNAKAVEGDLIYTSSDPDVAYVTASGTVYIRGTGIAYITVATKNNVEYVPAEKVIKITVKPMKPDFKVTSPAKKKIEVKLTRVEGATKYQIRYGRNGKYYNKYVPQIEGIYATKSVIIGNRKSNTNYFVKVRSYKTLPDGEKVWGNWTTIKKIKAK